MVQIIEQDKARKLSESDYVRANLPRQFWDVRMDKIKDAKAKKMVQSYLARRTEMMRRGVGMLLFGPHNSGKSCIAAGVLKTVIAWGYTGYWIKPIELEEGIRLVKRYDDDQTIFDRANRVHMLVIDDLTLSDANSDYLGSRYINQIIRLRYDHGRPTILTTAESLDPSTKSKSATLKALADFTGWVPIKVTGSHSGVDDLENELKRGDE